MDELYEPRLLTISQAAKLLGVHPNTLRTWADKGIIKHIRLPSGYRRFRIEDVQAMQREMGLQQKDER